MRDLIDRQAAIDVAFDVYPDDEYFRELFVKGIEALPSAQPEQTDCPYCHEDSDGYVKPIEKNCHAFVNFGMDGWEISLKAKGWHGSAKIRYCPICGRRLKYGEQTAGNGHCGNRCTLEGIVQECIRS